MAQGRAGPAWPWALSHEQSTNCRISDANNEAVHFLELHVYLDAVRIAIHSIANCFNIVCPYISLNIWQCPIRLRYSCSTRTAGNKFRFWAWKELLWSHKQYYAASVLFGVSARDGNPTNGGLANNKKILRKTCALRVSGTTRQHKIQLVSTWFCFWIVFQLYG